MGLPSVEVMAEIVAGFIVTVLIYNGFLWSLHSDSILASANSTSTSIISGFIESSAIVQKTFNCSVPSIAGYVNITPSVNRAGGSQFSYSLWVYVGNPLAAMGQTIFVKGDASAYNFDINDNISNNIISKNDRVAFCPELSFGKDRMCFDLSFNTLHNVRETLRVENVKSEDSVLRHNLPGMYTSRWVMLTMTFGDSKPFGDFENGLLVSFYLDDVMYVSKQYSTAIKQNQGNLHMFPDGTAIPNCKIADLKYYNYALSPTFIATLVSEGPSTQNAHVEVDVTTSATSTASSMVKLGDYNRTDMYNS